MFETSSTYSPIEIGVERDGLEEFLLQPLRAEQTKRRDILPLKPYRAPTGKLAFIRSLQPFFSGGDVVFAKELPILKQQLLSFPSGRIDVPNALAYALRMRPGLPIYENFSHRNVSDSFKVVRGATGYLALNATRQHTCAALLQVTGATVSVVADWVREGDPGSTLADIYTEAALITKKITTYCPPNHWQGYDIVGLQPAAARQKKRLSVGGDMSQGREELRKKLETLNHGQPALLVSPEARWTLNGFAGGYCKQLPKDGRPATLAVADEGPYKILMEAIESFIAVAAGAIERDGADERNYAIDAQGRKYLSARAHHGGT